MQLTKLLKYSIILVLLVAVSLICSGQESDTSAVAIETDTTDVIQEKKGFKLFQLFKKNKNRDDNEDRKESNDTIHDSKEKKGIFKLFSRTTDSDTLTNDSLPADTGITEKKGIFRRTKKDSTDNDGKLKKPQRISVFTWNKMSYSQQDSLLRAWDEYDKAFYKEKKRYKFNRKEVNIAIKLKQNRNLYEKLIYKRARKKPFKFNEKLIKRKNKRYKKTLRFDRMRKIESEAGDSISGRRKYELVNRQYKREAKKEAIRKNKVIIKFNRKEDRLRQKYELTDNEMIILNKGKGMRLKGTEQIVFNRARKKQEKFTTKLLKLRKKRAFELQNETVQKKMKKKKRELIKREKEQYSDLLNRKKKKRSDKHDSHEYPKRYHK